MVSAVEGLLAGADVGEHELGARATGGELLKLGKEALSDPASALGLVSFGRLLNWGSYCSGPPMMAMFTCRAVAAAIVLV